MNKTYSYIVGAIAVIALIVGIWAKITPATVVLDNSGSAQLGAISNTNAPAAGTQVDGGPVLPNPSVFDYLVSRVYLYYDKALGMGNGTSVPTQMQVIRQALVSGTSTPCAIANPFTATSTVSHFTMNITTATSSTIIYSVGTSTTAFATTSSMMSPTVAGGTQATLTWDPGVNNDVISSGQFIVAGAGAGTTAGTGAFSPGIVIAGTCQATFVTDN